jgi:hypothetical protein
VSNPEIKILPEFIRYLKEKDLKMTTMSEFLKPPVAPKLPATPPYFPPSS